MLCLQALRQENDDLLEEKAALSAADNSNDSSGNDSSKGDDGPVHGDTMAPATELSPSASAAASAAVSIAEKYGKALQQLETALGISTQREDGDGDGDGDTWAWGEDHDDEDEEDEKGEEEEEESAESKDDRVRAAWAAVHDGFEQKVDALGERAHAILSAVTAALSSQPLQGQSDGSDALEARIEQARSEGAAGARAEVEDAQQRVRELSEDVDELNAMLAARDEEIEQVRAWRLFFELCGLSCLWFLRAGGQ